ncbi:hypothetical protein FOMPIDRAFT_1026203 [Fomitopsis schrenkii]|uniref:Mid2 domain-containing protein n=1 Tax=Fomitopsis schrenkii TaxID=2126942 RepID=S8EXV5_FOMSC|nr:hypothetical protein FOMPIDRAFT_1026203 [Fomitopsis schrenkii]
MRSFYLLSAALLPFLARPAWGAGNTTCAGSALDWYTNVVGETPCMTYQRLRQICNSDYEVPSFRVNTPGDNCDDQVSACCCNSISWALSMLCMNCQWDTASSSSNGIDAGVSAYYMYRFSEGGGYCGSGTNQSLPTNIQTAACNQGIKLEKFLYSLFWTNGAWFYTYTRETAETNYASNGDGVFYCSSSSSSSATHSSTAAALLPSSSSSSAQPTSTLAGTTTASPNPTTSDTPVTTSQQQSSSAVITVTHSSSVVTTFESQTTINGTATTVPIVTTVITAVPSTVTGNGTALGLGATGGEHKSNTAAIAGGVVGGVVGLVLLGALIAWYARTQRKDQGPGGASLSMDTSVASPSSGPTSPHMAERNGSITPFVAAGDPFSTPAPSLSTMSRSGKWSQMQYGSAYAAPSSTSSGSGSGSGSGSRSGRGSRSRTGPSTGTDSREALSPVHGRSESTSSFSQPSGVVHMAAMDPFVPVVQEEDAGRLTGGGIRLPPAYQSEWNSE